VSDLASVTADDVRDTINVTAADIADSKVVKMMKKAETTLKLETGRSVDYNNCTDEEALFITNLSAMYVLCHLTGGTAAGLSFSVGSQRVDVLEIAPPLNVLQQEIERVLSRMKTTLKRV
jgi:hypothetical protein